MAVFEINIPSRVIVGLNVINRLPEIVQDYGDRVMIVTSKGVEELGILKKVVSLVESKAYGVIVFDQVKSESGTNAVDEGVLLARESRTNLVIGVGGANILNIAKAIAFIGGNEGYISDYFAGRRGRKKKISYFEAPTTHGIAYGLLDSFFVRDVDDDLRKEYRNRFNFADVVLFDPKLTTTLPNKYVVAIGMEVLGMAFDAYVSRAASLLTQSYAENAMELVAKNIKQAVIEPDNTRVRQSLCTGAVFASLALSSSRPGSSFALSQPLSCRLGLYHGLACSLLLPHIMEFNLTASPNKYVKVARALGEDVAEISVVEAAIKAVEAVRKILFDLNVPQRLRNFEIEQERLEEVVRDARTYDFLNVLPRPVTYDDLLNILMSAY